MRFFSQPVMNLVVRPYVRELLVVLAFLGLVAAPASAAVRAADRLHFCSPQARLDVGRTQVIPMQLDAPYPASVQFTAAISPPGMIEVIQPATFLDGERT